MEVGFIGLGKMGAGIAKSLLRAGHRLVVYNRTNARCEAMRAHGAGVAASIAEVCRCEVVVTMLSDDAAVEAVTFVEAGILVSLQRGAVHISLSTISVALSKKLAAEHERAGHQYVAAPVFGRPEAAESARLAIVAAGSPEAIRKSRPLFEAMGPKLLVAGEQPEMANTIKLAGNFLIGSVIESIAEVITLARKSGVDAEMLIEFLTSTVFPAPVYKIYGEAIVKREYEPAKFAATLGLKDIRLVLAAADSLNVPMPLASALRDRCLTAVARGNAESDWSVLGRIAEEDAGLAVPR